MAEAETEPQRFSDAELELTQVGGSWVPFLRLNFIDLPHIEIRVGDQHYRYERSYPSKGHSAVLPRYLQEQMAAGRRPLVVERSGRLYMYFATE